MCDLSFASARFPAVDPCGRQFQFRLATEANLKEAASLMSLYLWFGRAADFPPDHLVRLSWSALRSTIPRRPRTLHRPLIPANPGGDGVESRDDAQPADAHRADLAAAAHLRLDLRSGLPFLMPMLGNILNDRVPHITVKDIYVVYV